METHLDAQHKIWGIRPGALREVSALLRAELTPEQIRASLEGPEPELASRYGNTRGGVAVIPLQGMITPKGSLLSMLFGGGGGLMGFRQALREAVSNDDIETIVLNVDSPGGRVDLVPETAADVREAKEIKPVIAVANTMAASAAYWIASQATELVVSTSGEVGSIGVFLVHEEWSEYDKNLGIGTTIIRAGRYKAEGNPFEPLTEEAKENFQFEVDEIYDMFIDDVAKGRGVAASKVRTGMGEGRMASAQRATGMGMADRVDTLEGVISGLVRGNGGNRRAEVETPVESDETTQHQIAEGDQRRLAEIAQSLNETTESLKED